MSETILSFFSMGGHGLYIWISYSCVLTFLAVQWLIPWRRFRKYKRELYLTGSRGQAAERQHAYDAKQPS